MKFLHPEEDERRELSLDDCFIVPGHYEGVSRMDVDVSPVDFDAGSIPVVAANMNAVTGKRMAETMARYGGIGVLPQDMRTETVERIVSHIKGAHPRFDTPLSVTPDATLRDVQGIIRKRSHDMVVVVDEHRRPVGIVTHADLKDRDQYTSAERFMATRIITLDEKVTNAEAFAVMNEHRVKAAPVVDGDGRLVGVLGREDVVRMELLQPALDAEQRLQVAAAIGISTRAKAQAAELLELGIAALVIDTAHGDQRRMLETLSEVKPLVAGRVPIVAGNVCTPEGTKRLIDAGADIVKVNVGPGAMCTTRMQTAVGRPSFTSVLHCAREARKHGKHVWADGGVRRPRDVVLYLAAGASRVMVGTMLAGTYESPGDIQDDRNGRLFKENYGMASARAVADRTENEDAFTSAKKGFFREGISSSRIYLSPGFESVGAIVVDVITGLKSAMTYVGGLTLEELYDKAVVGVQTVGGFHEGRPHGRVFERGS